MNRSPLTFGLAFGLGFVSLPVAAAPDDAARLDTINVTATRALQALRLNGEEACDESAQHVLLCAMPGMSEP